MDEPKKLPMVDRERVRSRGVYRHRCDAIQSAIGGKNNVTEQAISVPSVAEPTSKSPTEPKMVDPVFDWDHTQTELRETDRALMRFEHALDLGQEEVSHE